MGSLGFLFCGVRGVGLFCTPVFVLPSTIYCELGIFQELSNF